MKFIEMDTENLLFSAQEKRPVLVGKYDMKKKPAIFDGCTITISFEMQEDTFLSYLS